MIGLSYTQFGKYFLYVLGFFQFELYFLHEFNRQNVIFDLYVLEVDVIERL